MLLPEIQWREEKKSDFSIFMQSGSANEDLTGGELITKFS